jgi:hypothetical protein
VRVFVRGCPDGTGGRLKSEWLMERVLAVGGSTELATLDCSG